MYEPQSVNETSVGFAGFGIKVSKCWLQVTGLERILISIWLFTVASVIMSNFFFVCFLLYFTGLGFQNILLSVFLLEWTKITCINCTDCQNDFYVTFSVCAYSTVGRGGGGGGRGTGKFLDSPTS